MKEEEMESMIDRIDELIEREPQSEMNVKNKSVNYRFLACRAARLAVPSLKSSSLLSSIDC